MPEEFQQYTKVFFKVESEHLSEHKFYDHAIDLKLETPDIIRSKVYPMSVNKQKDLNKFLKESLCKGYIIPSKSLIAFPNFFIKKKDRHLHLVQD